MTKKVPKRHEMDVHDVPGEKPKHETSLLKTSHNENGIIDVHISYLVPVFICVCVCVCLCVYIYNHFVL